MVTKVKPVEAIKTVNSNSNGSCVGGATMEAEGTQRFRSNLVGYEAEDLQGNTTKRAVF